IGPDPRNFNQRVSLGRNDLLIRTFPNKRKGAEIRVFFLHLFQRGNINYKAVPALEYTDSGHVDTGLYQ
ncbi:hypothetical protein V5073_21815, partial [Citrobacter braakii]